MPCKPSNTQSEPPHERSASYEVPIWIIDFPVSPASHRGNSDPSAQPLLIRQQENHFFLIFGQVIDYRAIHHYHIDSIHTGCPPWRYFALESPVLPHPEGPGRRFYLFTLLYLPVQKEGCAFPSFRQRFFVSFSRAHRKVICCLFHFLACIQSDRSTPFLRKRG